MSTTAPTVGRIEPTPCVECDGYRLVLSEYGPWSHSRTVPCGRCSQAEGNEPCEACGGGAAEYLVPFWVPSTPRREGHVGMSRECSRCAPESLDAFVETMECVVTTDICLHETLGDDERHYLEAKALLAQLESVHA